jgi:hypothetical protein
MAEQCTHGRDAGAPSVGICPALGVNPSTTFSVALPRFTPPVTLT